MVGVLLLADLGESILEVFDVALQPNFNFFGKSFTEDTLLCNGVS